MDIYFNLLIRTASRPNYFKRCLNSIDSQTYKNIRKYIICDEENDINTYVKSYMDTSKNVTVIQLDRIERKSRRLFPYNSYINEVANDVKDGWTIIINDDVYLKDSNVLFKLAERIKSDGNDPENAYICKSSKFLRETPTGCDLSVLKEGDIHLSSVVVHTSKLANYYFSKCSRDKKTKECAEYDAVRYFSRKVKLLFYNNVISVIDNTGDGLRQDMAPDVEKKKVSINNHHTEHEFDKTDVPSSRLTTKTVPVSSPDKKIKVTAKVIEEEEEEEEIEDEEEEEEEVIEDDEEEEEEDEDTDEVETEVAVEPKKQNPVNTTSSSLQYSKLFEFNEKLNSMLKEDKIVIMSSTNLKDLVNSIIDALNYEKKSDQLLEVLETKYFQTRTSRLSQKIRDISNDVSESNLPIAKETPLIVSVSKVNVPKVIHSETEQSNKPNVDVQSDSYIHNIYVITDNDSSKNAQLNKNKIILDKAKYKYEVCLVKDMMLYTYQKKIAEKLQEAKERSYERVLFINGNDLISVKFRYLFEKQISKITTDCYLWLMGNKNEYRQKDILNTPFDLDTYISLYDDVEKAKLITQDKALHHWKLYGHRESRFASINVNNKRATILSGLSGILISENIYDIVIDSINKWTLKDKTSVFTDLQKNSQTFGITENIYNSYPELVIPNFGINSNPLKNKKVAEDNSWYLNHYLA